MSVTDKMRRKVEACLTTCTPRCPLILCLRFLWPRKIWPCYENGRIWQDIEDLGFIIALGLKLTQLNRVTAWCLIIVVVLWVHSPNHPLQGSEALCCMSGGPSGTCQKVPVLAGWSGMPVCHTKMCVKLAPFTLLLAWVLRTFRPQLLKNGAAVIVSAQQRCWP